MKFKLLLAALVCFGSACGTEEVDNHGVPVLEEPGPACGTATSVMDCSGAVENTCCVRDGNGGTYHRSSIKRCLYLCITN